MSRVRAGACARARCPASGAEEGEQRRGVRAACRRSAAARGSAGDEMAVAVAVAMPERAALAAAAAPARASAAPPARGVRGRARSSDHRRLVVVASAWQHVAAPLAADPLALKCAAAATAVVWLKTSFIVLKQGAYVMCALPECRPLRPPRLALKALWRQNCAVACDADARTLTPQLAPRRDRLLGTTAQQRFSAGMRPPEDQRVATAGSAVIPVSGEQALVPDYSRDEKDPQKLEAIEKEARLARLWQNDSENNAFAIPLMWLGALGLASRPSAHAFLCIAYALGRVAHTIVSPRARRLPSHAHFARACADCASTGRAPTRAPDLLSRGALGGARGGVLHGLLVHGGHALERMHRLLDGLIERTQGRPLARGQGMRAQQGGSAAPTEQGARLLASLQ